MSQPTGNAAAAAIRWSAEPLALAREYVLAGKMASEERNSGWKRRRRCTRWPCMHQHARRWSEEEERRDGIDEVDEDDDDDVVVHERRRMERDG